MARQEVTKEHSVLITETGLGADEQDPNYWWKTIGSHSGIRGLRGNLAVECSTYKAKSEAALAQAPTEVKVKLPTQADDKGFLTECAWLPAVLPEVTVAELFTVRVPLITLSGELQPTYQDPLRPVRLFQ